MEQLVLVRALHADGTATVVHVRESACSGDCHKCAGCGAAQETITLRAANPIGATVGALVKVESATAPVLRAAAVLYLLPLVLFFLGYLLAELGWGTGGIGGGVGFLLGIAAVIGYDRRMAKQRNTEYTITGFAGR